MKKYIVSDLHGNGNIYSSIMGYLNNVNKDEEVCLYINGDLIDRGTSSADMLLDIKDRIQNNIGFKIEYLAGNHELMMYDAYEASKGEFYELSDWLIGNGGYITLEGLKEKINDDEIKDIVDFISNLKIYHKFKEKINDRQIVLVHAKCPNEVEDECNLRIKDTDINVFLSLWTRKHDMHAMVGNGDYFTIIGHTPAMSEKGYYYYKSENVLNIDGGCAAYACGSLSYDHTPLVEIDEEGNRLIILTFNNSNEIIYGNYFQNNESVPMSEEELEKYKKYIDESVKVKKLEP